MITIRLIIIDNVNIFNNILIFTLKGHENFTNNLPKQN